MIHVWSRVTCHHFFLNGSRECRGYGAQEFLLIPQYYACLKRVFSELSNDTKHDVVWWEYRLRKSVKMEYINSRQSSISGVNHVGVQTKCAPFSLDKSRKEGQVCQRRSSFEDQSRHLQKDENLCRAGILKTAPRKMWARFIRKCIGPKRGAMHAQKQEWDLIDINK